jgi:hypothetical protein
MPDPREKPHPSDRPDPGKSDGPKPRPEEKPPRDWPEPLDDDDVTLPI